MGTRQPASRIPIVFRLPLRGLLLGLLRGALLLRTTFLRRHCAYLLKEPSGNDRHRWPGWDDPTTTAPPQNWNYHAPRCRSHDSFGRAQSFTCLSARDLIDRSGSRVTSRCDDFSTITAPLGSSLTRCAVIVTTFADPASQFPAPRRVRGLRSWPRGAPPPSLSYH